MARITSSLYSGVVPLRSQHLRPKVAAGDAERGGASVPRTQAVGDGRIVLDEARLAEIRRQIAAGTYLTEEKLDVACARLGRVLRRLIRENERAAG